MDAFLAGPVLHYLTARNVPADATSQLSAHLSFGTLSARTLVACLNERARDRFLLAEERLSLDAYRRVLALRDFFFQLAWFFEAHPDQALQERMRHFPFAREHAGLDAWREGRTGYPLVDAGIRELAATGRMHPRARAVAASFLCFDLGLDWRIGRDAWDGQLIEDEPALATGNWQWIAGVGADLAQFPRIYSPHARSARRVRQALDPGTRRAARGSRVAAAPAARAVGAAAVLGADLSAAGRGARGSGAGVPAPLCRLRGHPALNSGRGFRRSRAPRGGRAIR
jgi:deoxyribodipyrimidine photo-lyase